MSHRRTRSQDRMATAAEEADLLAAAQAQAAEEEAISGRLPREVLNIHRRLATQQSSVDAIQGDISKLTDMVAQIGLVVNRSQVGTPNNPTASDTGAPPFTTPPPPPQHLSPIPEANSYNPTPQSRQLSQPASVQFGNLTPDQLPHPSFPPSSQSPQIFSAPPITGHVRPSSSTNHNQFQQTTSPASQPQNYNPFPANQPNPNQFQYHQHPVTNFPNTTALSTQPQYPHPYPQFTYSHTQPTIHTSTNPTPPPLTHHQPE
jgi:hypothetical protein